MDNAPDSGPAKKPTPRTNAGGTSNRKPATPRTPAARKPATPKPAAAKPAAAKSTAAKTPAKGAPVKTSGARTPAAKTSSAKTPPAKAVAAEPTVEPIVDEPILEEPVEAPLAEIDDETVLAPRDAELVTGHPDVAQEELVAETQPEPGSVAGEADAAEPEVTGEAEPAAPAEPSEPPAPHEPSGLGARIRAWRQRRSAGQAVATVERPALASGRELFDDVAVAPGTSVLSVTGLTKRFDDKVAVAGIDLQVEPGAFYGIVGPNGAGKTTTLSMITGLLRPDSGRVVVNGSDVWTDTVQAKRMMGVLPDRLRLFDRLTGAQLLYYAGVLRGLDGAVVRERTADLAHAFGLEESLGRLVSDYSAGMTKKIALAAAMIHSPRLLVLDEPFESVDPVSAATVTEILRKYVAAGGTVVLSSHSMDLVQRICDHVAVIVGGEILADGTMAEVRGSQTLEERFVDLAGGRTTVEGLEWLHTFSA